ncbi:hypothetical protein [Actinomadura craniellae]|nr:hypothetical protein [Actinomadura craniellae]
MQPLITRSPKKKPVKSTSLRALAVAARLERRQDHLTERHGTKTVADAA